MKAQTLDALLFPAASGAAIAAKPGYPTVIVPFGTVANAPTPGFPSGFERGPLRTGVSFTGMACAEPRLIEPGVRLRAGDAAACATAGGTVARFRGSEVPGFRGVPKFLGLGVRGFGGSGFVQRVNVVVREKVERLDRRLRAMSPDVSWTRIRDAIARGQVTVDDWIVRDPGVLVDDRAEVVFDPARKRLPHARIELARLYEDDDILVIDKPAGLLTMATTAETRHDEDTVLAREGLRLAPPRPARLRRTAPSARSRYIGRDGARAQPRGPRARP